MTEPVPVYAVLLAAGASTRFGTDNKLLADLGGQPLITLAVARLLAADVAGVIAVVAPGPDGAAVTAALRHLPINVVVNADAALGMGTSIARGTTAVPDGAGIMIVPADMPSLDHRLIDELITAFRRSHGQKIVHPVAQSGHQRNPVIWPAWTRAELMSLDPQTGGKPLLAAHLDDIVTVSAENERAFDDIDTQEDLARARSRRP